MARLCPNCGSTRLIKEGFKNLKEGRKQRWRCKACNHGPFYKPKWTRGKSKQSFKDTTEVLDTEGEEQCMKTETQLKIKVEE